MSKEQWKYMIGTDERYKISDHGNVYSCKKDLILSFGSHKTTYLKTKIKMFGIDKTRSLHRLVAIHFIDNPNGYKVVHHKDHNKHNNHYKNLEWTTHSNNTIQAISAGKIKHDSFKFANTKIDEARLLTAFTLRDIFTQKQIMEYLDFTQPSVWNLFNGKTHKAYTRNLINNTINKKE